MRYGKAVKVRLGVLGSVVVRSGVVGYGCSGLVWLGVVRYGKVRWGMVGLFWLGLVRCDGVWSGLVRHGLVLSMFVMGADSVA